MSQQTIKNLLTTILTSKPVSSIASKITGTGIPIFMLHRIFPDNTPNKKQTPAYLRKCLGYLKDNGYTVLSIADILFSIKNHHPLPHKTVAFTIDDGFYDQASLAASVFIEFNYPVTIFLITDFLDGRLWPWFSKVEHLIKNSKTKSIEFHVKGNSTTYSLTSTKEKRLTTHEILKIIKTLPWNEVAQILEHLSTITQVDIPNSPPEAYKPMTWATARELEKNRVTFGPHTQTHPILSMVGDEQSSMEINQSWQRLKEELVAPSPVFCYPNGMPNDYGKREIETIKQTDMLGALSTTHMLFKPDSGNPDVLYNLPRFSFPDNFHDFKIYCSWIEHAKESYRLR